MSTTGAAGVVTGEAVLLDVRAASFASRAVSGAIDLTLAGIALFAMVFVVGGLASRLDDAAASALLLVVFVAVAVGVPVLVETLTRGRTLGKLVMGLRTVRDDGGPIRLRQAVVRALVGARRYGLEAERRLREAAAGCGRARVLDPLAAELLRFGEVREEYSKVTGATAGARVR